MAKGRDKNPRRAPRPPAGLAPHTKHGLMVVFLFALAFILALSFFGLAGLVGVYVKQGLTVSLGVAAYAVPLVLLLVAYVFLVTEQLFSPRQLIGFVLLAVGATALVHSGVEPEDWATAAVAGEGGGYLGYWVIYPLSQALGRWGAVVMLVAVGLGGILILFETSLTDLANRFMGPFKSMWTGAKRLRTLKAVPDSFVQPTPSTATRVSESEFGQVRPFDNRSPATGATKSAQPSQPPFMEIRKTRAPKVEIPLELLEQHDGEPAAGNISANQEKIQKTLMNFGIDVEMGSVNVGPTVTQYTLKPAEGVKLASITALSNDLALALAAHPIRIEAPIPGQSLVGIEVPNQTVATVSLKEILMSEEFKHRKSNLTVALGKDVAGRAQVADIDRMPHLLIAGATGSGKSMCINSIMLSLLYTNSPDELKLLIVDPKRVELASYNDVPHLLTPVITEVPKTINALKWVVSEMDRRYQVFSQVSKRNLAAYNQTAEEPLPYILVVIDELADLMAVAAAEVEAAIIRLAQMARAVGIHLIVATQRPSVDVITGLIKANITSRIAFSVASQTDSRTILDSAGAEKLLGRGDGLFISSELSKPKRLQGAMVTDAEIERVTTFLKQSAKPDYNTQVVEKGGHGLGGIGGASEGGDDLLDEAQALVIRAQKASASFLQRRMRVGYARAARLLDLLEERGVIGPGEGAKPRDVLIHSSEAGPVYDQPEPEEPEMAQAGGEADEGVDEEPREY